MERIQLPYVSFTATFGCEICDNKNMKVKVNANLSEDTLVECSLLIQEEMVLNVLEL